MNNNTENFLQATSTEGWYVKYKEDKEGKITLSASRPSFLGRALITLQTFFGSRAYVLPYILEKIKNKKNPIPDWEKWEEKLDSITKRYIGNDTENLCSPDSPRRNVVKTLWEQIHPSTTESKQPLSPPSSNQKAPSSALSETQPLLNLSKKTESSIPSPVEESQQKPTLPSSTSTSSSIPVAETTPEKDKKLIPDFLEKIQFKASSAKAFITVVTDQGQKLLKYSNVNNQLYPTFLFATDVISNESVSITGLLTNYRASPENII